MTTSDQYNALGDEIDKLKRSLRKQQTTLHTLAVESRIKVLQKKRRELYTLYLEEA